MDPILVNEILAMRQSQNREPRTPFWKGFCILVDKIDIEKLPFQFYRGNSYSFNCRFYDLYFQISANRRIPSNTIHVDFTLKGNYSAEIYDILLNMSTATSVQREIEELGFIFPRTFGTSEQDRTFSTRAQVADAKDETDWDSQYEWMKSRMIKAYELFGSETQRLCRERYG